jgi:hypothetical protein
MPAHLTAPYSNRQPSAARNRNVEPYEMVHSDSSRARGIPASHRTVTTVIEESAGPTICFRR